MTYFCPECGKDEFIEEGICSECQIPLKFLQEKKEYGEEASHFRDEFKISPFAYLDDDLKFSEEEAA
jgi:hypothetical protein